MDIILLLATILLMSVDGVLSKTFNKKTNNRGAFLFCGISCTTGCLYFFITGGCKLDLNMAILPYVLAFAAAYAITIVCSFMAVRTGPLSLSALALAYSAVIPTLFGLFYYREESSVLFFIGIAMMVTSIFLVTKAKDDKKISLKWAIFALATFLFNGTCSTVQTLQQKVFFGEYKNELMVLSLGIAAVTIFCIALWQERKDLSACIKNGLVLGVAKGSFNGMMNFLVMVLALRMASSLLFPILSVGTILASSAFSVLIYKEKLSRQQYIGLAVGLAAIVLLNL